MLYLDSFFIVMKIEFFFSVCNNMPIYKPFG